MQLWYTVEEDVKDYSETDKTSIIRGPATTTDHDYFDAAVQSLHDPLDPLENKPMKTHYLKQVAHHMSYTKWVVFTDLHCAPSTLDTTLEVLDRLQTRRGT
jgi:hypothetical protein